MREIKFRGKRLDNGEWIEGCLCQGDNNTYIVYDNDFDSSTDCCGEHLIADRFFEVDSKTVGQYIGLKDSNEIEIYEGDILKVKTNWERTRLQNEEDSLWVDTRGETYWTVEYKIFNNTMGFRVYGIDRRFNKLITSNMVFNNKAEVIGNIYDNPELIAKEK